MARAYHGFDSTSVAPSFCNNAKGSIVAAIDLALRTFRHLFALTYEPRQIGLRASKLVSLLLSANRISAALRKLAFKPVDHGLSTGDCR
jgi:hypothetical protein